MTVWQDPAIDGDRVVCDCGRNPVVVVAVSAAGPSGAILADGTAAAGGVGIVLAGCVDHVDRTMARARAYIDELTAMPWS